MTERQQNEQLLADLLQLPGQVEDPTMAHEPVLTLRDEQKLLKEANEAEPPTLAPEDARPAGGLAVESFRDEVVEVIRRNPIPALLLGVGLAFLLTRRRR